MSSWLAAWPASLLSREERGVVGGDVSQRMVVLSSWVACGTVRGTKPGLEAHSGGCGGMMRLQWEFLIPDPQKH